MKRKGIDNFRRVNHLTWRRGNPETDVDGYGRPIHDGYAVPVRVADCTVRRPDDEGRVYIDPQSLEDAPCLPGLRFSRSNMAYGPWRRQTQGRWFCVDGEQDWYTIYWTCPVYWIENNRVYRGTRHRHIDPQERAA